MPRINRVATVDAQITQGHVDQLERDRPEIAWDKVAPETLLVALYNIAVAEIRVLRANSFTAASPDNVLTFKMHDA